MRRQERKSETETETETETERQRQRITIIIFSQWLARLLTSRSSHHINKLCVSSATEE